MMHIWPKGLPYMCGLILLDLKTIGPNNSFPELVRPHIRGNGKHEMTKIQIKFRFLTLASEHTKSIQYVIFRVKNVNFGPYM